MILTRQFAERLANCRRPTPTSSRQVRRNIIFVFGFEWHRLSASYHNSVGLFNPELPLTLIINFLTLVNPDVARPRQSRGPRGSRRISTSQLNSHLLRLLIQRHGVGGVKRRAIHRQPEGAPSASARSRTTVPLQDELHENICH